MVYILSRDRPENSYEEWRDAWPAYLEYLASVEGRLPRSAYEFAVAPWHYDFADHRAPHDGWLEELLIREPAGGERREIRSVEISVRLLAAYHDGHIELRYSGVKSYALNALAGARTESAGHGDWLYDEIRLSERGLVLHEIEWADGGLWVIECGDVEYGWLPAEGGRAY